MAPASAGAFFVPTIINPDTLKGVNQVTTIEQLKRIRERIEDSSAEAVALIDRSIEALSEHEGSQQDAAGYVGPRIVTRAGDGHTKPESGISDDERNWSE